MKKFKILAIVAAMLVLCCALIACGGGNDNNDDAKKEKVTLTVWGSQEDQDETHPRTSFTHPEAIHAVIWISLEILQNFLYSPGIQQK